MFLVALFASKPAAEVTAVHWGESWLQGTNSRLRTSESSCEFVFPGVTRPSETETDLSLTVKSDVVDVLSLVDKVLARWLEVSGDAGTRLQGSSGSFAHISLPSTLSVAI